VCVCVSVRKRQRVGIAKVYYYPIERSGGGCRRRRNSRREEKEQKNTLYTTTPRYSCDLQRRGCSVGINK